MDWPRKSIQLFHMKLLSLSLWHTSKQTAHAAGMAHHVVTKKEHFEMQMFLGMTLREIKFMYTVCDCVLNSFLLWHLYQVAGIKTWESENDLHLPIPVWLLCNGCKREISGIALRASAYDRSAIIRCNYQHLLKHGGFWEQMKVRSVQRYDLYFTLNVNSLMFQPLNKYCVLFCLNECFVL